VPVAVAKAHREVQAFAGQVDTVVVREEAQVDERMGALKLAQVRQQPAHRERADRPHREHLARTRLLEAVQHRRDARERIRQQRQQGVPFVRQRQAARDPPEEAHAETALEVLDVLADGRRAQVKLRRGPREVEVARRNLERAKSIERQIHEDGD